MSVPALAAAPPDEQSEQPEPAPAETGPLKVLRLLMLALLGLYTAHVVFGDVGYEVLWDALVYNGILVLAVAVAFLAARHQPRARGWYLIAASLAASAGGDLLYAAITLINGAEPETATIADIAWLAFYPLALIGTTIGLRDEPDRLGTRGWLDALVAGLGIAATVSALAFGPILAATGGDALTVGVTLGYPIGDLALLAVAGGVFAVRGFNTSPRWVWMSAGLLAFAVADVVYVYQVAKETYVSGTVLDILWAVGLVLMAVAATDIRTRQGSASRSTLAVLAAPGMFAVGALGLLLAGNFNRMNPVATWLAGATLLAVAMRVVVAYVDVTALSRSREEARTDDLTGLPNRRAFYERAAEALASGAEERWALLLIDLDHFKEINDTLGHKVGDELLGLIGPRLRPALRSSDLLARLGGDEFAILLRDVEAREAREVGQRLRDRLRIPFELDSLSVHIDGSIGIALYPEDGATTDLLMQRADIAMYNAKGARSGVEHYLADRDTHARDNLRMVDELRQAVAGDELILHFQPKWEISTRRVSGVEALVRWQHPREGLLIPDRFLPLVEQTGLMSELTCRVLELAAAQARAWLDDGVEMPVAVNLSAVSFLDERLVDQIRMLLDEHGLPARLLEIEITEDILIADPTRAAAILNRLRRVGVRVSVDDYGTGYCSLAYLRSLPIDELKLDRAFIAGISGDPRGAAIVRSTVDLAHSLGLEMVAEGVEDEETLATLTEFGCDIAQGYYFSRPLPADQLDGWLKGSAGDGVVPAEVLRAARQAG